MNTKPRYSVKVLFFQDKEQAKEQDKEQNNAIDKKDLKGALYSDADKGGEQDLEPLSATDYTVIADTAPDRVQTFSSKTNHSKSERESLSNPKLDLASDLNVASLSDSSPNSDSNSNLDSDSNSNSDSASPVSPVSLSVDSTITQKTSQGEYGLIQDILIDLAGRSLSMLGSGGADRERAVAVSYLKKLSDKSLPVLIGSGAGYALELLNEYCLKNSKPLLVVDFEEEIIKNTKLDKKFSGSNIRWLRAEDLFYAEPDNKAQGKFEPKTILNDVNVLAKITRWQNDNGRLPLAPLLLPFYSRINRELYNKVYEVCQASQNFDFWGRVSYEKFSDPQNPRILLLTSKYFLMGEIKAACRSLGIEHRLINLPEKSIGHTEFIEILLEAVVSFKPDFVFTINHLGIDREGALVQLLADLKLPIASWFVDNPHLILSYYKELINPWTAIFTWDSDNIESLQTLGFDKVHYLPLGTDHRRFVPDNGRSRPEWKARISFVGNSMVNKVRESANKLKGHKYDALKSCLEDSAAKFGKSSARTVPDFIKTEPELYDLYKRIDKIEDKMSYEALLTWEATRQYRYSCVSASFSFEPLIVGDDGWEKLIPDNIRWRKHSEMSYYEDLPSFYPCSEINFNCTSQQMKGAVNQRVFDVPATESFLITDYRAQVEKLFEPKKEIVCYKSPEEAKELIEYYLERPDERKKIAQAARKRILQEHSYEHRLKEIIRIMHKFFG